ncbi:MAG: UDP-3-O-(3-hydroxymyristoyl)glucosamine N-acyltransferase [Neisseriaceae bacterium]|nr:MAG: UDP-3-O-(3-hydroxymyristoyl)glucosamine N-acyltransferase [Neisseriaceae bacterium]
MQYKLSELVAKFGGRLVGADVTVSAIAPTDLAAHGEITFLSDNKYKKALLTCKASAIIIKEEDAIDVSLPQIITPNPYYYFSLVSNLFNPRRKLASGISPRAYIDELAALGHEPSISHNVVIGANSKIGDNCQIFPNVVIGDNVTIGHNVIIYPNATIYDNVIIGDDCVFHSGCAVGSDGFGNAQDEKRHYNRIPQIGGVVIGNKVEIGANTTVDCGTFQPTIIKDGARIDNLVQIAHNVEIGAHTGIASQVGIAGNTKIGNYCMLGGNAGIADHVEICDYTVIGASSNVGKNITKPGLYSCGMTAMEYREWAKIFVSLRNIEKTNGKIRDLQNKVKQLEGNQDE